MKWFSLFRRPTPKSARHSRLQLEALEDRTVPAILFVVPSNAITNGSQFATLGAAINAATASGSLIQIEPGSNPGAGDTGSKILTIQGDPAAGPVSLPQLGNLTLSSSGDIVANLNLSTVGIINGATGETIHNSTAISISEGSGTLLNGENHLTNNTITGSISFGSGGTTYPGAMHDVILDNVFTGSITPVVQGTPLINITHDNNAVIEGNSLQSSFGSTIGIQVEESTGVIVASNIIVLSGSTNGVIGSTNEGIEIDNPEFAVSVSVTNNSINTSGVGMGIVTTTTAGNALSVLIQGNALVFNNVGIYANGQGTIDAGGGPLGSLGGNDFHGYYPTASGRAAIETANSATVNAEFNIFSVSSPASVVNPAGGPINVSSPLSSDQSFVQLLYNDMLGRTGSLAEINGWVGQIPSLGRTQVANVIVHSQEACYKVVDGLYVKLLGREGSTAEETGWVNLLLAGSTEEQVMADILSTGEFLAHAATIAPTPADQNTNYVEALYELLLARTADQNGLQGWLGAIGSLGVQGVAADFVNSAEFRTYAVQSLYFTNANLLGVPFFDTLPNILQRTGPPSTAEVGGWVVAGTDILTLKAVFGGSNEFYTNG